MLYYFSILLQLRKYVINFEFILNSFYLIHTLITVKKRTQISQEFSIVYQDTYECSKVSVFGRYVGIAGFIHEISQHPFVFEYLDLNKITLNITLKLHFKKFFPDITTVTTANNYTQNFSNY